MRLGRATGLALLAVLALAPSRADAAQHLWKLNEVYTNASGSVQYIEMFTTFDGQGVLANHVITVTVGAVSKSFVFPANLAGSTTNRHLLIATPGFANVPGSVTPDYTLPCGPFIPINATGTITIAFGTGTGAPYDTMSFNASTLPLDNTNSLNVGAGAPTSGANSPANANNTGSLALTTCLANGTCEPCADANFCNGPETCSINTCTAVAPCAQQCIEATDTCVECINDGHCNDNNPCTDDTCNGSNVCVHTNRTGSCDDNLFCNGADTCNAGTCTHAGTECGAQNCNEGPDTCGDCQGASDCNDDQGCTVDACNSGACSNTTAADGAACDTDSTFCNGVGTCTAGACGNVQDPCPDATAFCNEEMDACSPNDMMPDAGGPGENDPDGGGCCQSNNSPAPAAAPLLMLALASFVRRRRSRQRGARA
jgi:uncharacterized protein (TIGR03382 family)